MRKEAPIPATCRSPLAAAYRRTLAALVAVSLLVLAAPAAAEFEAPLGDRIFDAMVLRTLGFLGTAVGFGFFVCSLPLAGPAMKTDEAWDTFVREPAEFTFQRELGDF